MLFIHYEVFLFLNSNQLLIHLLFALVTWFIFFPAFFFIALVLIFDDFCYYVHLFIRDSLLLWSCISWASMFTSVDSVGEKFTICNRSASLLDLLGLGIFILLIVFCHFW